MCPEGKFGTSAALQPNRLDVVVHLCALDILAGSARRPAGADAVDWVGRSDEFATADGEPTMSEHAAALLSGEPLPSSAGFGAGGWLIRGATHAAAALRSGQPLNRTDASGVAPDRSFAGLATEGWSAQELNHLRTNWGALDPLASIVAVPTTDAEAAHELRCRFLVFDERLVHFADDALTGHLGSFDVFWLHGAAAPVADAAARHQGFVLEASDHDTHARLSAASGATGDASHQRLVRARARTVKRAQLLDRLRGR